MLLIPASFQLHRPHILELVDKIWHLLVDDPINWDFIGTIHGGILVVLMFDNDEVSQAECLRCLLVRGHCWRFVGAIVIAGVSLR